MAAWQHGNVLNAEGSECRVGISRFSSELGELFHTSLNICIPKPHRQVERIKKHN